MKLCSTCDGTGFVWRTIKSFSGKRGVDFQEYCSDCKGSGRIDDEPLATDTNRIVSVKVKRVKNGSRRA